jgi:hypothetical protein
MYPVRPEGLQANEPVFRLMVRFLVRPTEAQLAGVKELSFRLWSMPDAKLRGYVEHGTRFELGRFTDSELRTKGLESTLAELGVKTERVLVPGTDGEQTQ